MKARLVSIVLATAVAVPGTIAISQAASTSAHPQRGLHARFSILRTAKAADLSPATSLPALTEKHLVEPGTLVTELELEPARAAYVELDATTHGWVVPGRGGMCLAVSTPISIVSDCGPLTSIDSGGLIMVRRPGSGPVVYGLVPDGATVTAREADGTDNRVAVMNNVFVSAAPTTRSVSVQVPGAIARSTPVG